MNDEWRLTNWPNGHQAEKHYIDGQYIGESRDPYQPGAILESSWGYDQTNIDYFKIVKRAGDWLSLIPLNSITTESGDMRGRCRPGEPMQPGEYVSCVGTWNGKPIRRRLCRRDGEACGLSIKHGCAHVWDGAESHWTAYA
jgi:hypothetical protein